MKKLILSLLVVIILLTALIAVMLFMDSDLVPGRKEYVEATQPATEAPADVPTEETAAQVTEPSTAAATETTAEPSTEAPTEAVTSFVQNDVTYYISDGFTYIIQEDGTAAICGYRGQQEEAQFPEKVDGIPVTALDKNMGLGSLDKVTIPASIRTFLGNPFAYNHFEKYVAVELVPDHPYLTAHDGCIFDLETNALLSCYNSHPGSFSVPEGTTRIEDGAFYLTCFTAIHIPNTVTYVGENALAGGEIREITIPNSVTYLADSALPDNLAAIHVAADHPVYMENNGSLIEIQTGRLVFYAGGREDAHYEIPGGVTEIAAGAFAQRKNLKEIVVPPGVRTIGERAFCFSYVTVTLPDSVESIGAEAFVRCTNEDMTLPANLTHLSSLAFHQAYNLKRVTIPGSLKTIEPNVFSVCTDLAEVIIQEGVTSIGSHAFGYGQSLVSVTFPASVTEIADDLFEEEILPNLTATVLPGSYAESYCQTHGIAVKYA